MPHAGLNITPKITPHRVIAPLTPNQRRIRQQANEAFATLCHQFRRDQQMLDAHDRLRRHRLAQKWEREADAMVQVGFPYGFHLKAMAAQVRAGAL